MSVTIALQICFRFQINCYSDDAKVTCRKSRQNRGPRVKLRGRDRSADNVKHLSVSLKESSGTELNLCCDDCDLISKDHGWNAVAGCRTSR